MFENRFLIWIGKAAAIAVAAWFVFCVISGMTDAYKRNERHFAFLAQRHRQLFAEAQTAAAKDKWTLVKKEENTSYDGDTYLDLYVFENGEKERLAVPVRYREPNRKHYQLILFVGDAVRFKAVWREQKNRWDCANFGAFLVPTLENRKKPS